MRNVLFLIALLLAGVVVVPVFGQDAEPSVAEFVVASATGETPEFTTLLAAVQAADPLVLEALSDPGARLTLFAPTDAAFAALKGEIGEDAFNAIMADPVQLTAILKFHLLGGRISSADLGMFVDRFDGALSLLTLNGQYADIARDDTGAITVDGAPLNMDRVDIAVSPHAVVHAVDAVMLPETRTLAEVVVDAASADTPEFGTLLAAVSAADPAILEALSDPESKLTVFAPTDAAFAALSEALGEETFNAVMTDPDALSGILRYHVVPAVVHSRDLINLLDESDGPASVATAEGADIIFSFVQGAGLVINGTAKIVARDIDAANGVIHVIDAVIVPPAAQ